MPTTEFPHGIDDAGSTFVLRGLVRYRATTHDWRFSALDAEAGEIPLTEFTPAASASTSPPARLIGRRVKRLNPAAGQGELFAAYLHHALFTDSPLPMLDAEADLGGHAAGLVHAG